MKRKSSALSDFFHPGVLAGFVICLAGLTLGSFAFMAKATSGSVIGKFTPKILEKKEERKINQ